MPEIPDKIRDAVEQAKKAADRREDEIQQAAAQKVEPHLHDVRKRLAEASEPSGHEQR